MEGLNHAASAAAEAEGDGDFFISPNTDFYCESLLFTVLPMVCDPIHEYRLDNLVPILCRAFLTGLCFDSKPNAGLLRHLQLFFEEQF